MKPSLLRRDASSGVQRRIVLVVVATVIMVLAWALGWWAPLERPVDDLLLRALPAPRGEAPVATVAIDDPSIARFGPLPWSRSQLARLIEGARDAGARAVVIDLILAEPGEGDDELADALDLGASVLTAAVVPGGHWLLPLEAFGGARRAAHGEAEVGPDGVVREILATKQADGLALPALSLAAARLVRPGIAIEPGVVLRPDLRFQALPIVSAAEILERRDESSGLRGRVVFLGTTARGAGDQLVTATSHSPVPGVILHARAAAALLAGRLWSGPSLTTVLLASLVAAAAAQLVRDRVGRLQLGPMIVAPLLIVLLAFASLGILGFQLPLVPLVGAFGLSALLREVAESASARREVDALLRDLLSEAPAGAENSPRGVAAGLELAHRLQEVVLRDRDLRRALLDTLEDGVVRWPEGSGDPLFNRAAERLWGSVPVLEDLETAAGAPEGSVERGGRSLRVTTRSVDGGILAILRDVTADRELESRRRQMRRLVSHELKTPLAAIAGFGDLLRGYELSRDEQLRVADLITGESGRLLEMVRTFLDLERIGGGGLTEEDRELVDLGALAEERAEILRVPAGGHRLEVHCSVPAPVRGEPHLLARSIDNLVGNAFAHTPPGTGVTVEVETGDDCVDLRVADDGPGIPAEVLPRIFERFYRGPGSASPGSGLGLSLVQEIARWHGGGVRVDSAPGRGTVFTVSLPLAAGREAA